MKVYTRSGDKGTTGLLGSQRIGKDHLLLDAYGTVDELNSFLGIAHGLANESPSAFQVLSSQLQRIQNELFVVGSHLACQESAMKTMLPSLDPGMITLLENEIDQMEADLPKLTQFILPGGTKLSSALHVCRTVCRRAERAVFQAKGIETLIIDELIGIYLNRLSDYFFCCARFANFKSNTSDLLWQKSK